MNKKYWRNRIESYREMIEHIKAQRAACEDFTERRKITGHLEQLYMEISVIEEHLNSM